MNEDPERDPNDLARNRAAPMPSVPDGTPLHLTPMADHGIGGYDDFEDSYDDFGALAAAATLRTPLAGSEPPPVMSVMPLIPYQLSGLAAYVPLPPGSPLRRFIPYRKRPGRPGQERTDPDGLPHRRPIDPV